MSDYPIGDLGRLVDDLEDSDTSIADHFGDPSQPCHPDKPFNHEYGSGIEQEDGGRIWTCATCGDVQTASAAFLKRLEDDRKRIFAEIGAKEKEQVRLLGERIGYGNMMHRASELWAEDPHSISGTQFVIGPCASMTVPCVCAMDRHCEWCCGCGWVTKHVALLRAAANAAYHHFNADWIDDRKDGPVVRVLGEVLGHIAAIDEEEAV